MFDTWFSVIGNVYSLKNWFNVVNVTKVTCLQGRLSTKVTVNHVLNVLGSDTCHAGP